MKKIDTINDSIDTVAGERSHGARTDGDDEGNEKDGKQQIKQSLPLYKLFSFADSTDVILMGVGTVGAVGAGAIMPLMTVIVGNLAHAFGENQDVSHVVQEVSKVGKFMQLISTFCVGYTLAFVRGWLLTLAIMATIPPLMICGWLMSKSMIKVASRQHRANAEAYSIS